MFKPLILLVFKNEIPRRVYPERDSSVASLFQNDRWLRARNDKATSVIARQSRSNLYLDTNDLLLPLENFAGCEYKDNRH
jgi:hypothetical protein